MTNFSKWPIFRSHPFSKFLKFEVVDFKVNYFPKWPISLSDFKWPNSAEIVYEVTYFLNWFISEVTHFRSDWLQSDSKWPIFLGNRLGLYLFSQVLDFEVTYFSKLPISEVNHFRNDRLQIVPFWKWLIFWIAHFDKWSNSKWPIFRSDRLQSVWKIVSEKLISKWPI